MTLKSFQDILDAKFGLIKIDSKELDDLKNYLLDLKNLNSLIKQHFLLLKKGSDHASLQLVLSGESVGIDQMKVINNSLESDSIIDYLSSLPCSVKLAGLQNSDGEIKKLSQYVFKKYGIALFSNMYISPPGDKFCYTYHVDPHKVFFLHLLGVKRWYFPMDKNGEHVFFPEIFEKDQNQVYQDVKTIDFKPGDMYYNSKGIVHKAENLSDETVIHVTFPMNQPDMFNFMKTFIKDSINLSSFEKKKVKELNDEELYSLLVNKFKDVDINRHIKSFIIKNKMKNLYVSQLGRPHSGKSKDEYERLFL